MVSMAARTSILYAVLVLPKDFIPVIQKWARSIKLHNHLRSIKNVSDDPLNSKPFYLVKIMVVDYIPGPF
jgi:hypothetical protein